MDTTETQTLQSLYPVVRHNDAKAAIAWLVSALGFEEHLVCPGEGESIAHAELKLGGNLIMLGNVKEGETGGIYVALDSPAAVDGCYARAKKAGAEITRDLCDTDYGSREFGLRDSEGHMWGFGSYRP